MDWGNDAVLEFVKLIETEPSIWNPKHKYYKSRTSVTEAWVKIMNQFSVPCTVKELKRKRNSLLTQYRDNIKKIKDSQQSGSCEYKPTWFAFDAMHEYLSTVYCSTLNTKDSIETKQERSVSRTSNLMSDTDSNGQSEDDSYLSCKRRREIQDPVAKNQTEGLLLDERQYSRKHNKENEELCYLYGQLLAEKLKLLDMEDRLILMNQIDNLVFNNIMKVKQRNLSNCRPENSKSKLQFQ